MPHYQHASIDVDSITDDYDRQVILNIANRHNALVEGVEGIQQDIDGITGETPEEKELTHAAFAHIRHVAEYFHKRRFNIALLTIQAFGGLSILRMLGIDTTQAKRIVEFILTNLGA